MASTPQPIGIDLGTTNSCVATIDQSGRTVMVRNAEGELLTPSAVFFDDNEVIVGKEARKVATIKPGQVAEWVKRDMGTPVYSRPIRGEYLPPEVIQACILRKLKADAVAALGPELRAVITVPAYFDEPRRKATEDAGRMAGLDVLDIVNEPTAAALAFGEALGYLAPGGIAREAMTVAVYDLGGGTFDATLLRLALGDIRTLATDGDVQLGGYDWDMRLLNYVADTFRNSFGCDPRDDPLSWQRLYENVVEAKHTLSVRARTTVHVEHAGLCADIPVSRDELEQLTADLLERTAYTTRQLMAAAKMSWPDLNRILLVGGSTRMPCVTRMLRELTGLEPDHTVNPDEAVARGAAIYAHYLLARHADQPTKPTFQVTDVNAHSLGVEGIDPDTLRKTNVILIPRNTPLPAKCTNRFTTKTENQRSIVIQVLEGESTIPGECRAIGRTVIHDLPAGLPKGWPVEVTFEYGANGRLSVRAVVPGTHRETTLELERDRGLSIEGISRWKHVVCNFGGFGTFERLLHAIPLPQPAQAEAAGSQATAPAAVTQPPPLPADGPFCSQPSPLSADSQEARFQPAAIQLAAGSPPPAVGIGLSSFPQPEATVTEANLGVQGVPEPTGGQAAMEATPGLPAEGAGWSLVSADNKSGGFQSLRHVAIAVIGYVVSAVLGLAAGYFLVSWLWPELKLRLW